MLTVKINELKFFTFIEIPNHMKATYKYKIYISKNLAHVL